MFPRVKIPARPRQHVNQCKPEKKKRRLDEAMSLLPSACRPTFIYPERTTTKSFVSSAKNYKIFCKLCYLQNS